MARYQILLLGKMFLEFDFTSNKCFTEQFYWKNILKNMKSQFIVLKNSILSDDILKHKLIYWFFFPGD
jgi:hypothetical protein